MGDPGARKDYRVLMLGIVKQVQQTLIIVYSVVLPYENFSLIRRRHRCRRRAAWCLHSQETSGFGFSSLGSHLIKSTHNKPGVLHGDTRLRILTHEKYKCQNRLYQIDYLLGKVMKILFKQQTSLIQIYRWFIS